MKEINHKVFGKIKLNRNWWERKENVDFYKKNIAITIGINGTEEAEFEQTQIDAFSIFLQNIEKLLLDAELSIYEYYQEVYLDYRERQDDFADQVAPIISSVEEVGNLVQLNEIIFPWSFKTGIRQVGLLLNCTWEPEHGLAIKFEDEKIVEVGYQDIIL